MVAAQGKGSVGASRTLTLALTLGHNPRPHSNPNPNPSQKCSAVPVRKCSAGGAYRDSTSAPERLAWWCDIWNRVVPMATIEAGVSVDSRGLSLSLSLSHTHTHTHIYTQYIARVCWCDGESRYTHHPPAFTPHNTHQRTQHTPHNTHQHTTASQHRRTERLTAHHLTTLLVTLLV